MIGAGEVGVKYVLCPTHTNQPLTHVCMAAGCKEDRLVCHSCIKANHKKHQVLALIDFREKLSNLRFSQEVSNKARQHSASTKQLVLRKCEIFADAKKRMMDRMDQLERGVAQYLTGVEGQVQQAVSTFNVDVPMQYDGSQPASQAIRSVNLAANSYLSCRARQTELQTAIPQQTNKVKATFQVISNYLQEISTKDSTGIKDFMKFMTDNGYARAAAWEERAVYDNRKLIQQIQYSQMGKGPQRSPKSMWADFWKQNRPKLMVVLAIVVFILAIAMKSSLTAKTVSLNGWDILGKNGDIQIQGKNIISKRQSGSLPYWSCAALRSPLSNNNTIYSLRIHANDLQDNLAIGICNRTTLTDNNWQLPKNNIVGKGCYLFATDGKAYSSWQPEINQKHFDWQVKVGDTLELTYDPRDKQVSFSNNDQHLLSMKSIPSNQYAAVLCFTNDPTTQQKTTVISIV